MVDEAFSRSASKPRYGQGIDDEVSRHTPAHRPADHLLAEQVDDDGQVQPAFLRGDVCYISGPHQIRSLRLKIKVQHVIRNQRLADPGPTCGAITPSVALANRRRA